MKVYYMKEKALDALQKDVEANLDKYQSGNRWIDQYFIEKETPKYYFDTGIEVPDYELVIGGPETDFENAKILFEAFHGKLNPVQASDLRLWAYLAHVQHWEYMNNRWKVNVPDEDEDPDDGKKSPREKALERVKNRYFYNYGLGKDYVRQGIARLYWSVYLTYDEGNENPYEYTELLFTKQDVLVNIGERSYGRNRTIALAAMKELKKHPDLSREDTRLFFAKLNQAGAITVLDFLDEDQATQLCKRLMDEVFEIPKLQDGCSFMLYDNITGKAYSDTLKLVNGRAVKTIKRKLLPGMQEQIIDTNPKTLRGKREGSKVTIDDKKYVIKDIQ